MKWYEAMVGQWRRMRRRLTRYSIGNLSDLVEMLRIGQTQRAHTERVSSFRKVLVEGFSALVRCVGADLTPIDNVSSGLWSNQYERSYV